MMVDIGVALGTLAVAAAAAAELRRGRTTMRQATEATRAATRAADEAARTRIDARAPRPTVLLFEVDWPGLVHTGLNRVPGGDQPSLFASVNVHGSEVLKPNETTFTFPKDENYLLWFTCTGVVVNEGNATCEVRFPCDAKIDSETTHFDQLADYRQVTMFQGQAFAQSQPLILPPRSGAVFRWAAGRPLKDWAAAHGDPAFFGRHGAVSLTLISRDFIEDGVVDYLYVSVNGRPLEPIPGEGMRWRVAEQPRMGATRWRAQRLYPSLQDSGQPPKPPWTELD